MVAAWRRGVVAVAFALLAAVVVPMAWSWLVQSPHPDAGPALALVALLLVAASALGVWSAWSQRVFQTCLAVLLIGAAWLVHAIWRLSTVPERLRAVTFGGDVVQSAFALTLFAGLVLWAAGAIAVTLRDPPPRSPRP